MQKTQKRYSIEAFRDMFEREIPADSFLRHIELQGERDIAGVTALAQGFARGLGSSLRDLHGNVGVLGVVVEFEVGKTGEARDFPEGSEIAKTVAEHDGDPVVAFAAIVGLLRGMADNLSRLPGHEARAQRIYGEFGKRKDAK